MLTAAKNAVVLPLLKKPSLDSSVQNNYRPISNLTFLGKVIERVVLKRLVLHIPRQQPGRDFPIGVQFAALHRNRSDPNPERIIVHTRPKQGCVAGPAGPQCSLRHCES